MSSIIFGFYEIIDFVYVPVFVSNVRTILFATEPTVSKEYCMNGPVVEAKI
jgi:hypothetical protein